MVNKGKELFLKYIFDPDSEAIYCKRCSEDPEKVPKFGRVYHLSGKRYFVAYAGTLNTPNKFSLATFAFRDFYASKLKTAAEDIKKAASCLDFFSSYISTIGDSDGV